MTFMQKESLNAVRKVVDFLRFLRQGMLTGRVKIHKLSNLTIS